MEKIEADVVSYNHGITLVERKSLMITGVKKIENFDSEEFLLETVQGYMNIKGENLEVVKLDTYQGNVTIKGRIDAIGYIDENAKKESSVFTKLFK